MKHNRKMPIRWKRFIACFLAVLLSMQSVSQIINSVWASVASPWDGDTMTVPQTDEDGVFLITSGAELAWFANEVNTGNGEINARLENTIWLNDHNTQYEWIMIGNSLEHPYKGTFDGNGQRIHFLYAVITNDVSQNRYGGLFGVIDGGIVSNVSVSGTIVHAYETYGQTGQDSECYVATGGIAGYLKNGKITNCVNDTETEMAGDLRYRNAGGIVGICSGSVIRCTNSGELSTDVNFAQRHIGGIAGTVYGSGGQVRYCSNTGSVQGNYEVGGIAGSVKYGAEIQASCNYGSVSGVSILGGIVGNVTKTGTYSNGTAKECVIRNVYNLGSISGTTSNNGSIVGGIAGQMGYEDAGDEDTPSMPILENAYSTVQYKNDTYMSRGAIVGYFKSGYLGNVYGMSGSDLEPCAVQETKTTNNTGSILMKSETELKSVSMIKLLGSSFVKTNKYDYDNSGFPKLAWQGQTSDLAEKVDAAVEELNGWLSEANRLKYGSAYLEIEAAVANYTELLGSVVTDDDLEQILSEAKESLSAVKPGMDSDNDLAAAIDEGILTLEAYFEELLEAYPDWSLEQVKELEQILNTYILQIEKLQSLEQVALYVRFGKDALDEKTASYEEEKRLEEIRLNAKNTLALYRSEAAYGEPWDQQIVKIKNEGFILLDAATTVLEVRDALKNIQDKIDDIINQIPGENAWDGVTITEPSVNEDGVYQIGTGAELAWFGNQVNTVPGMNGICGELTADINLGNQNWIPIGGNTVYLGSFDGNGYKIRGMKITEADTYAGLFGAVYGDENQSIVNLTVAGTIQCPKDVSYAGGIVGYISGKNESQRNAVENCHSQVLITISKVTKNDSAAGGVAGYAKDTWFRNCSNEGTVSIDSVGKGGIQYYVGGILGYAAETVSIRRCYNAGYVWAEFGAGGLIGKAAGSNCEFTSNYNYGEVQAATQAGGLIGQITDTASGSVMKWSYNSGPVNINKNGEYVGAIAGSVRAGSFEDVYALMRSEQPELALVGYSASNTAPGTFVSSSELQREMLLNNLNLGGNYFIRDYLGIQSGYPILSWQLTLNDFKSGAITELQTFVTADEYTEENWRAVENIITLGITQIQSASDMELVNEILNQTKLAVYEVESIADTFAKQLEEVKEAAITEIRFYVDTSLYRAEEQTKISVYVSDAIKRISLAETKEQVEEYLLLTKENIDRLPTKEEYMQQQDAQAAAQVDNYILNIGEVVYTDYVKMSINIARNAYESLTDSQKILVTQYQTLLDAEAVYAQLSAENTVTEQDQLLAAQADSWIAAIGNVTLESGPAIQMARHAYDALTDLQKTLVTNPEVLTAAEAAYDELRAREVSAIIASIGEVTLEKDSMIQQAQAMYDALTDKQKALVTSYDVLTKAKVTLEDLTAVQGVIDIINQIGTVTLDSGSAITSAVLAYNMLTGTQQSMVLNYYLLEQAASNYDSLQAIAKVERYIDQIGAVNESSSELIARARNAYDMLSKDQKDQVSNYKTLVTAEKAYEAVKKEKDEETTKPVGSVADLYQNRKGNPNIDQNSASGIRYDVSVDETNRIGMDETGSPILEDGYVPVWEDAEEIAGVESTVLDSTGTASLYSTEREKVQDERTETIMILGIVLGACAAVTGTMGFAVRVAGKKRKAVLVHY